MIGLWRHECKRVFVDKLINETDKTVLIEQLNKLTIEKFREKADNENDLITDFLFCDFLRGETQDSVKPYEAIPSVEKLK